MDLSEAFDTLNHKPLNAKSKVYGLDSESTSFLRSYLTETYQRTRIGNAFSDWESIAAGASRGSILGPLLFNIFMNDIFFYREKSDACNVDDSTLYTADKSLSVSAQMKNRKTTGNEVESSQNALCCVQNFFCCDVLKNGFFMVSLWQMKLY